MNFAFKPKWPELLPELGRHMLDLVLPPLCPSCDKPVSTNRTLCPDCWGKIHFIAPPFCKCCGMPFDVPVADGTICGSCLETSPPFAQARAAILYNEHSRHLAITFKHADRTYMAPTLAGWLHRAGHEFWADADFIVPVPLHHWRLLKRRYNQAGLLAQQLGKLTDIPVLVDGLLRTRQTPTQGHLRRKERQENVKGAFTVKPSHLTRVKGKNIVLIDDVLTTGATLHECAKTLMKTGASKVNVLTLARVRGFD